jgi:hypothetical protein
LTESLLRRMAVLTEGVAVERSCNSRVYRPSSSHHPGGSVSLPPASKMNTRNPGVRRSGADWRRVRSRKDRAGPYHLACASLCRRRALGVAPVRWLTAKRMETSVLEGDIGQGAVRGIANLLAGLPAGLRPPETDKPNCGRGKSRRAVYLPFSTTVFGGPSRSISRSRRTVPTIRGAFVPTRA